MANIRGAVDRFESRRQRDANKAVRDSGRPIPARRPFGWEKDQITPVDPTKAPKLDQKLLASFPVGYRHLAYLQTKVGYKVKDDMPGVDGPGTDALYALGANWLKGSKKIGW